MPWVPTLCSASLNVASTSSTWVLGLPPPHFRKNLSPQSVIPSPWRQNPLVFLSPALQPQTLVTTSFSLPLFLHLTFVYDSFPVFLHPLFPRLLIFPFLTVGVSWDSVFSPSSSPCDFPRSYPLLCPSYSHMVRSPNIRSLSETILLTC